MADLNYLWTNRARFTPGSRGHVRAWAKRILSLPELARRNWRSWQLRRGGASIDVTAEIGEVKIGSHAERLSVGADSFLGQVEIVLHDRVTIGRRVVINDGVTILTASHQVNDPAWTQFTKPVTVGDYAWIGMKALVLPGVSIGKGAVVGAGAVVSKSVPDYGIVVGNPGRLLEKTRTADLNYNPCEYLTANRAWIHG